jgi:vacuolar-type H+-ATPase subunit H
MPLRQYIWNPILGRGVRIEKINQSNVDLPSLDEADERDIKALEFAFVNAVNLYNEAIKIARKENTSESKKIIKHCNEKLRGLNQL